MGQVFQSKVSKATLGILLATVVILGAQFANAQARFGQPGFGGNGCPEGLPPKLGYSKGILSVQFNNFLLDDAAGKTIDRKACTLRIPVTIDPGYQIILKKPEYRGVVRVPAGHDLITEASADIVGQGRIVLNQTINVATNTRSVKLTDASQVLASACGQDAMLGLAANVRYIKRGGAVQGLRAQARSMLYQVVIQKCN